MDNKEKIKYLSQYGKLLIEYRAIKDSYDYLRNQVLNPTLPMLSDMPKGSNFAHDKLSQQVLRLMQLEELIQERFDKIIDTRMEIEHIIASLNDTNHRCILALRYIEGMKFEKIAIEMNYYWRHIHRLHNKALEQVHIPE